MGEKRVGEVGEETRLAESRFEPVDVAGRLATGTAEYNDFVRSYIATMELELAEAAREYPARPVFRCALAYAHARLGRVMEATREVIEALHASARTRA